MAKISISEKQARFYLKCMVTARDSLENTRLHASGKLVRAPHHTATQEVFDAVVADLQELAVERDSLEHKLTRVDERRSAKPRD